MSQDDDDSPFVFAAGHVRDMFYQASKREFIVKVKFFDKNDNLVDTIELPNLCWTEQVESFKPKTSHEGSLEERCGGRVWILRSDGRIECPSCGYTPNYDKYDDPSYNADHRHSICTKCNINSWANHSHINGVCQPKPPVKVLGQEDSKT